MPTCRTSGDIYLTSSDYELMDDGSEQVIVIVFPNTNVPQGAGITEAYVTFQVDEVNEDADVTVSIYGEAGPSAAPTDAPYDVSSRTATAAAYTWQPQASVAVGEPLVTPNIAKVVEEIVGGSGWTSGSSMGILFGKVSGVGVRTVESSAPPISLSITYIEMVTGQLRPIPLTAFVFEGFNNAAKISESGEYLSITDTFNSQVNMLYIDIAGRNR